LRSLACDKSGVLRIAARFPTPSSQSRSRSSIRRDSKHQTVTAREGRKLFAQPGLLLRNRKSFRRFVRCRFVRCVARHLEIRPGVYRTLFFRNSRPSKAWIQPLWKLWSMVIRVGARGLGEGFLADLKSLMRARPRSPLNPFPGLALRTALSAPLYSVVPNLDCLSSASENRTWPDRRTHPRG